MPTSACDETSASDFIQIARNAGEYASLHSKDVYDSFEEISHKFSSLHNSTPDVGPDRVMVMI